MIPDASAPSLKDFMTANIEPGAVVNTDGWRAYPPALARYVHEPINVSASGKPAHESLPAMHRIFALVKRTIDGTYRGAGTVEHLPEHLDKLVFSFNRQHGHHPGLVFMRPLQHAVAGDPVTFESLARVSTGHTMAAGFNAFLAWLRCHPVSSRNSSRITPLPALPPRR